MKRCHNKSNDNVPQNKILQMTPRPASSRAGWRVTRTIFATSSLLMTGMVSMTSAQVLSVTTLAGHVGVSGSNSGIGTNAWFNDPIKLIVDNRSRIIYVVDTGNNIIRGIDRYGMVTNIAGQPSSTGGTNDGIGTDARFNAPNGIALDGGGNIYVTDAGNNTIRKLAPTPSGNWIVSTIAGKAKAAGFADGSGAGARFNNPLGIAVDDATNLYVADGNNQVVRYVTLTNGIWQVSTIAGKAGSFGSADGNGANAEFNGPNGIAIDRLSHLYVADANNNTIRQLTNSGTSWWVTTIAGQAGASAVDLDGSGPYARFDNPRHLAVEGIGRLYVTETYGCTIRKLTADSTGTNWTVTTVAGSFTGPPGDTDGTGASALFYEPKGIAVDDLGYVYVADSINNTIRVAFPSTNGVPSVITYLGITKGFMSGMVSWVPPGKTVVVESSTNLYGWTPIQTNAYKGPATSFTNAFIPLAPSVFLRAFTR